MRFAQQLGSHAGAKANPQISGLRGLVARLCPSRSWLSHVPRLAGNLAIALQCPNGERPLLKSQAHSARGWPVLWGRGRGEKFSRAPRIVGDHGRVPLQSLERSRSITRWCCNPLLQHPALSGRGSRSCRAAKPQFISSARLRETPNPWLGPDKWTPSVASPVPRNIFPVQTKSFSSVADSPATSVLDNVLDY